MSRPKTPSSIVVPMLAAFAALTVAVGCSSDTTGSGSGGGPTAGGGSAPTSASNAPSGGSVPTSAPSGGSRGGSTSAFCADWQTLGGTPDLSPGSALNDEIAKFEKADADAPAAIKSDMDAFLAAVKEIAKGHAPTADYTTAVQHVVLYIGQHCH